MALRTPFWWYGGGASLMPILLEPAALVWRLATSLRWAMAKPYRAALPVVCVGNLTAGGAGKTPAAIAVARILERRGETPVFITRGYGGSVAGPRLVDAKHDTAAQVGDEPLLLAQTAPTIVSADRAAGAKLAETLDASIVVMDDGFQNPSLAKDLSILVVDRSLGIGNGLVIPAGPLRASLRFQLARAQAVLLVGEGGAAEEVARRARFLDIPLFDAEIVPSGAPGWLRSKPVLAFAGIAHPRKFFRTLEETGAKIADRVAFPDHHAFSEADAQELLARAAKTKARLVTTEKDLVRLPRTGGHVARLRKAARALPVRLKVSDQGAFETLLTSVLRGRRNG